MQSDYKMIIKIYIDESGNIVFSKTTLQWYHQGIDSSVTALDEFDTCILLKLLFVLRSGCQTVQINILFY